MQFSKFLLILFSVCSIFFPGKAQKKQSLLTKKYPPQELKDLVAHHVQDAAAGGPGV